MSKLSLIIRSVLPSCLFIAASSGPLLAQETTSGETLEVVVVTASHLPVEERASASSVTVIPRQEIERSQKSTVLELLYEVPGIDVVQSGGPGGNTAVFLRGANAEHTLVLVDGIEVNNPGSNARFYNFADFPLENIERIEILRGPQSGIYGSDAMGGVIQIITRRGDGPATATASVEGGSYETYRVRANTQGQEGMLRWSLGFFQEEVGGVSAASSRDGNVEDDGYHNTSYSARIGIEPVEEAALDLVFRWIDSGANLDDTGGPGGDDPNRLLSTTQTFFRAQGRFDFFEGRVLQVLGVSVADHKLRDNDDPDDSQPTEILRSRFDGRLTEFDFKNEIVVSDELRVIAGAETEEEKASNFTFSDGEFGPFTDELFGTSSRTNGYYTEALLALPSGFSSSFAVRLDDPDDFDEEVTYRIAPAYFLESTSTKLFATVGTGFKSPSLYQRFSSFGNQDLKPEESIGWDVGFKQFAFDERGVFGVTYFRNEFEDLITFDPSSFIFENINEAETQGIEVVAGWRFTDDFRVDGTYTYADTEDDETGRSLLRRARNSASLRARYEILEDEAEIGVRAYLVGKRFDNDFAAFPPERVKLGSYTIVDITGEWRYSENVKFLARVENLFDKEYEEVFGFGTLGAAAYAGVEIKL